MQWFLNLLGPRPRHDEAWMRHGWNSAVEGALSDIGFLGTLSLPFQNEFVPPPSCNRETSASNSASAKHQRFLPPGCTVVSLHQLGIVGNHIDLAETNSFCPSTQTGRTGSPSTISTSAEDLTLIGEGTTKKKSCTVRGRSGSTQWTKNNNTTPEEKTKMQRKKKMTKSPRSKRRKDEKKEEKKTDDKNEFEKKKHMTEEEFEKKTSETEKFLT